MAAKVPETAKTVLEPTPGMGNLVAALNGYSVVAPDDFFSIDGWYDAVVMNPPFTPMALGYKILDRVMGMSDNIIALMPWLTIINSEKRTKTLMDFGLKSIAHLPRSTFKGARIQACVLDLSRGFQGQTVFETWHPKTSI